MTKFNVRSILSGVLRLVLPLFFLLIIQVGANAQSYTPNEQACYDMVQGKVAYDRAGNKNWLDTNLRRLCMGTANPTATIDCFSQRVSSYNDWERGIRECTGGALASTAPTKVVRDTTTTVQPPTGTRRITRSVTIKNNAGTNLKGYFIIRSNYDDPLNRENTTRTNYGESDDIHFGDSKTLTGSFASNEDAELWIISSESGRKPIFKASLPKGDTRPAFCFEVTGTLFVPTVKACDNAPTYESKHISFRNESGFNATMSLTYYALGNSMPKKAATISTSAGFRTKLYLPMDADTSKQMVLTAEMDPTGRDLLTRNVTLGDFTSTCYKAWGNAIYPKISPCSTSTTARTIKLWNNSGYVASMTVLYYDKDGSGRDVARSVSTNKLELTQTESIEVPVGTSSTPVKVSIYNNWSSKLISETPVNANFTGELCYKVEGTTFAPTASTCDGTVGDTTGSTRQIRFQNDSGFDAAMIITYFEDQVIGGGQKMATLKTLTTGMINGLGKSRVVTMPLKTSGSMPITIFLKGNATLRNDIWTTTLPANFAASPQPCFKVWGTLFDPQGGKCDQ